MRKAGALAGSRSHRYEIVKAPPEASVPLEDARDDRAAPNVAPAPPGGDGAGSLAGAGAARYGTGMPNDVPRLTTLSHGAG